MNKEKEESKKYIFSFGNNKAEGGNHLKGILGNKGAGLAEMSKLKIPVPPGFTISSKMFGLNIFLNCFAKLMQWLFHLICFDSIVVLAIRSIYNGHNV